MVVDMCRDMFLMTNMEGSQNKHSAIKLHQFPLVTFIDLPLLYKLLFFSAANPQEEMHYRNL